MNVEIVDLDDDRVVARFETRPRRYEPCVETLFADSIAQSLSKLRGNQSVSLLVHSDDKP